MKIKIRNREIVLGGVLATLAIAFMPLHTLWFGTLQNPFEYTLSMIGNRFDMMTEFIIWGVVTGLLIVFYLLHLYRKVEYRDKKARRFLVYSNIFLVLTVLTPAVEEVNSLTHKLHFVFGSLFALFLSLSIFFFIRYLKSKNEMISRRSMRYLFAVILGSLSLLVIFGGNGIFELYFFLSLSAFLLFLKSWINQIESTVNPALGRSENQEA